MEELIRELNALGEAVIFLGDGVTVYQEMLKENMQVPYSFAPAHLNKQRAELWEHWQKNITGKARQ